MLVISLLLLHYTLEMNIIILTTVNNKQRAKQNDVNQSNFSNFFAEVQTYLLTI